MIINWLLLAGLTPKQVQTLADLLDAHGREIQAVAYLILRDRLAAEDVQIMLTDKVMRIVHGVAGGRRPPRHRSR